MWGPAIAHELSNHQCVLRSHPAEVPLCRRQAFSYRSAAGTAGDCNEARLRIRFVFGGGGYCVLRYAEKTSHAFSVGQQPGFNGPHRDPEAHSRHWIGKISARPKRGTFLLVEVTKRKPGRMTGGVVEATKACFECGDAGVVDGSSCDGQAGKDRLTTASSMDPSTRQWIGSTGIRNRERTDRHLLLQHEA